MCNGKGKEKYIWDYQCKEEGIEIKKQKDTTTRCESIKKDKNGITTYIYHTVNEKGEIFKTINKQNKAGKFFYYKRTKGPKDELTFEQTTTFAKDDSTKLAVIYINYKKGTPSYKNTYSYDKNGNELSTNLKRYNKRVLIKETSVEYVFDDKGRPISRIAEESIKKEKELINYTCDY